MASHDQKQNARRAGGITRTVNAGFAHHQAGRLKRAEALYRKALEKDPDHAEALHLLGVIAYQRRNIETSIALIERALPKLPALPEAHLNLGNALRDAGRLAESTDSYRRAIALDPEYGVAHSNLAGALNDQDLFEAALESSRRAIALLPDFVGAHVNCAAALLGLRRFAEAEAPLRRAIQLMPDRADSHRDLGFVLAALGRLDEAAESYERATILEPNDPRAHNSLGITLDALGRPDEAVESYRRAFQLNPEFASIHNNLGNALREQGQFDDAVASYRRALAVKPDFADAYNNLGGLLPALGRLDEAVENCRRALDLKPDFAEAHNNLGNALRLQKWYNEAERSFRQALALKPDFVKADVNLGIILCTQNRLEEAIESYRQALALAPDDAQTHTFLGGPLADLGRFDEAAACYQKTLALEPDRARVHCLLGNVLKAQGKLSDAVACFDRAIALDPHDGDVLATWFRERQNVCDWSGYYENEAKVRTGIVPQASVAIPFVLVALSSSPAEQLDNARRVADAISLPEATMLPRPQPRPGRRIRLGYLSADFRQHPVAALIAELIERHDRRDFQVIGYSFGPRDGSTMRGRFTGAFDRFVDINKMTHQQAAELIHEDGVDILIDLTGYTAYCRPTILAYRPAPIQVSYLGYPGTMGANFIDYIIVDAFLVPPEQQPFYAERLVYLPDCYQPSDTRRQIADPAPSGAACGLPEKGFVFCSFNAPYKFTPALFDIWMRLLNAVPGSVLWLSERNDHVKDNLRREASCRGVDAERLVFAPPAPMPEYLARLRLADLFLDTLPYNAGATANDALWVGLPVLTCAGETYVGRMAGALLTAAGLPELITTSLEAYETLAFQLATEPSRLTALRQKLEQNRSTTLLFDTERFTRNLEAAYRRMWETWRAEEPPAAFSVAS